MRLYEAVAPFQAVISAAGLARFGSLGALTYDDFQFSFSNKLMGQVNLVLLGLCHMQDQGSFTLTSGVLAREPMPGSAAISLVNAGLEGFVRAAALEMLRGIRINVVSPPWVKETLEAMGRDSSSGMPAARVAAAYIESLEGKRNGEVLDARTFA
jgi:NAD(P)-dependent dehydrogenase (short-subunit alcohol dehydrogenase family)